MKGSYSSPLVGQYTWVYGAAATPELDGRLIFAGEHTSAESPGFMNGGVESGNRAVKELLGEAEA
jgi:monoamine oxidase